MINEKTISLVIPCKNEERIIGSVLDRVPDYIDEVIVVDNNSTDKTTKIAKKHGVKVIIEKRKDENGIGYGYAHIRGMEEANGDYIVAMDGDNTYPMRSIQKIISHMITQELDFVSCNRLPLTNKHAISRLRQTGIQLLNLETSILFEYPIKDILSGMWVMSQKAFRNLEVTSGGWDLSPEIKLSAIRNPNIRFGEYHINHFLRCGEKSKQVIWKTGFDHLMFIWKLAFSTFPLWGIARKFILPIGLFLFVKVTLVKHQL
jgi:glycosyltransferase involved in cell wall biosynthesis